MQVPVKGVAVLIYWNKSCSIKLVSKQSFGDKIRAAREAKPGLTKYKLAKDAGVSESLLGRWERGDVVPSDEALEKLAPHLGIALEHLNDWAKLERIENEAGDAAQVVDLIKRSAPEALGNLVEVDFDPGDHPLTDDERALIVRAHQLRVWTTYLNEPEAFDETPEQRAWRFEELQALVDAAEKSPRQKAKG